MLNSLGSLTWEKINNHLEENGYSSWIHTIRSPELASASLHKVTVQGRYFREHCCTLAQLSQRD